MMKQFNSFHSKQWTRIFVYRVETVVQHQPRWTVNSRYSFVVVRYCRFGEIDRIILLGASPFAYIKYKNIEAAICTRQAVHDREVTTLSSSPRQLWVEYAIPGQTTMDGEGAMKHKFQLPNAIPLQQLDSNACVSLSGLPEYIGTKSLANNIIPGLLLITDFVSVQEESELLSYINNQRWSEYKLRHVQHYGFEFDYKVNNVHPDQPLGEMPTVFQTVIDRMKLLGKLSINEQEHSVPQFFSPDQLTINKYAPSHGIPPHVDTHSAFIQSDNVLHSSALTFFISITHMFIHTTTSRR